MTKKRPILKNTSLALYSLGNVYNDFILSRESMLVSKDTLLYYHRILGYIVSKWIEEGVTEPTMINKNHINGMLASIANGGGSDSYVHIHARCIRTFMNFMAENDLIAAPIKFTMPKIHQKKLPVLTEEQVPIVLKACRTLRNRALVMLMVDTGLRLSEVAALDWNDVDLETRACICTERQRRQTKVCRSGSFSKESYPGVQENPR